MVTSHEKKRLKKLERSSRPKQKPKKISYHKGKIHFGKKATIKPINLFGAAGLVVMITWLISSLAV